MVRPDLERLFGYRVGAVLRIKLMTMVLDEWLVVLDKKKVFFKISSNNKSIERTAKRYGFERLQNLDKGRFVYRLTQEEWLKRREQETKGREKHDALSVDKQL
jgi:RimJ/RimL family protein N-acetyltransferase